MKSSICRRTSFEVKQKILLQGNNKEKSTLGQSLFLFLLEKSFYSSSNFVNIDNCMPYSFNFFYEFYPCTNLVVIVSYYTAR